jgi:hypothetical protein
MVRVRKTVFFQGCGVDFCKMDKNKCPKCKNDFGTQKNYLRILLILIWFDEYMTGVC